MRQLSPLGPSVSVTVKLGADQADALMTMAANDGATVSDLVRRGVSLLTDPAVFAALAALRLAEVDWAPKPSDPTDQRVAA